MIRVLTFALIINILIIGIMGAAQNALNGKALNQQKPWKEIVILTRDAKLVR